MTDRHGVDRRSFVKGVAALGLFAAAPVRGLAGTLGGLPLPGATRASKLPSSAGLFVVHTDLHNHSLISGDAAGDPNTAYRQMRDRGIDVACVTEHAISGKGHGELTCPGHQQGGCHTVEGINDTDWEVMRTLADDAYEPGAFVSFRGFEWSTPSIGHVNVWFSSEFTDALNKHAFFTPRAIAEIDRIAPVPSEIVDEFETAPELATMSHFYEWLASQPATPLTGGGNDGIGCFNHPNEFGNFEAFRYDAGAAPYIVSCEAMNEARDFFWQRANEGFPNPLNACLNAGWRVGFTGVSDEHGTEFGRAGMARGGLWVTGRTREAVKAALTQRRSFATLEPGLRLDATANGHPMGAAFAYAGGMVQIELDIDRGPAWAGRRLFVEFIRPGSHAAGLAGAAEVQVPDAQDGPLQLEFPVDRAEGDWLFLRITDPEVPAHPFATGDHIEHGGVVAYTSPWFFD